MNKHIASRIKVARIISESSPCPRAQVGCVLFEPHSWVIISDGYNGPPRGGGHLCGGDACQRDELKIKSGSRCELGCHHAEINALMNAVRRGALTLKAWAVSTRDPCLMCAKALHHAGIARIYVPEATSAGCDYLKKYGVEVLLVSSVLD